MNRREFLSVASVASVGSASTPQKSLVVPVHIILDGKVQWRPEKIGRFWWHIWPEAAREFGWCGIRLHSSLGTGEVGARPIGSRW